MPAIPQSIKAKQLRLLPIARSDAKQLICARHESRSCPNPQVAYGVFFETHCMGVVVFALGNQTLFNIIKDGNPREVWELARLWLNDRCRKNSESRVLAIACNLVRKNHPSVKAIVTYTTPDAMIYKAAGFLRVPGDRSDKIFIVNGEFFYSTRMLSERFKTLNESKIRAMGHDVKTEPVVRCRWWMPLKAGVELRVTAQQEKHPDEAAVIALWRKDAQWLGWPGTFAIREALQRNSCVILRENGEIVAAWLFHRLITRPIFRDIGCVVRSDFRGRGLGAQLVAQAKAMADREGRCIAFDCKIANPACAFWDKSGFTRIGTRTRGKTNEPYNRYFYASKAETVAASGLQPEEDGSIPISTL